MLLTSPYPSLPPIPDNNVHHLMFNPLPGQPENPPDYTLHIDPVTGKQMTWYEFRELVYDGAVALGAPPSKGGLGLSSEAGDIVGIFSYNCIDFISLVHSLLVIATPFALPSASSTPFELAHALRTGKVTRLFVHPSLLATARTAAKEVGLSEEAIYTLQDHAEGKKSFQDLIDGVKRRGTPRIGVKETTKDTLAYLAFSSGTTGLPKAVMISHGNLWATILSSMIARLTEIQFLKIEPSAKTPVALLFLPLYHSYGLNMACFKSFTAPTTFVILSKWDVEVVIKAIPKFQVNALFMFPSAIQQLVAHPLAAKTDFSSIVMASSGAAYLPPTVEKTFKGLLKNTPIINEGYGMTEATLSIARKPIPGQFPDVQVKPGCAGFVGPGVEAKIIREDGSVAGPDENGELWARGPAIALGYFGNEKATKETFVDGWLRTGDTFRADKNGLLFFVDRSKDTLKVSGLQVSPTELEDVLRAHPEKLLEDVCVAGVSGGRTSDEKVPCAFIVLSEAGKKKGVKETIASLDKWSKQTLSKYKWLRGGFEVVSEIPKSPTGKVLRRVLQEHYERSNPLQSKL